MMIVVKRDLLDKDAWLVTFENGAITSIVKNDGSIPPNPAITYFTLKDGEGIMLYVPPGEYTITELGSQSGGTYHVEVMYDGESEPTEDSSWDLPEGEKWLRGNSKTYKPEEPDNSDIAQVSATVDFNVGEMSKVVVTNYYSNPPENGYLVITEEGGKPGETFLYRITDENGTEIIVSVTIGEDGTGETIVECPAGEYRIEEITNWAWRYEDGVWENPESQEKLKTATVTVVSGSNKENAVHADFTNARNSKVWLGGERSRNNLFVLPNNNQEDTDNEDVE